MYLIWLCNGNDDLESQYVQTRHVYVKDNRDHTIYQTALIMYARIAL